MRVAEEQDRALSAEELESGFQKAREQGGLAGNDRDDEIGRKQSKST